MGDSDWGEIMMWLLVGYMVSLLVSVLALSPFADSFGESTLEVNFVVVWNFIVFGAIILISLLVYFFRQFKIVRREQ